MSITSKLECMMKKSKGWLWIGVVLTSISLSLMLSTYWFAQGHADLGVTMASMLYTRFAQMLALVSFGFAGFTMIHRAATVCDHGAIS